MKHRTKRPRNTKSISVQVHREEFLDLFGVWTEADELQFEESVRDLEAVHPEDWNI